MSRRIAIIAPPWYPVPPHGYGGIEVVVALLARELRRSGDEVLLFAAEGSQPGCNVIAPARWSADLGTRRERLRELSYAAQVVQALRLVGPVDLVHDHCGFATLLGLGLSNRPPVLHTVHGLITEADRSYYHSLPPSVELVAISAAQRSTAQGLRWAGTVHNAVDVDELLVGGPHDKQRYLLCLARICADKGQHVAIEVARRCGMRLVLAGKVEESADSQRYYERHVLPAIDGDRVVYMPNVAGRTKARLLADAQALLAPLDWEEPFGLALVEAMASGTPVIAYPRGAVPELVTPGLTGFLVEDADSMVEAVAAVRHLDPARCASVARERFSPRAMAERYTRLYDAAAGGSIMAVPAGDPPASRATSMAPVP